MSGWHLTNLDRDIRREFWRVELRKRLLAPLGTFLLVFQTHIALSETHSAGVSSARVREALSRAVESRDPAAVTSLAWQLARMGAGLSEASRQRIAQTLGSEMPGLDNARPSPRLPDLLTGMFDQNVVPVLRSTLGAHVPVEHRLIEGIAFDPRRRRLFVGSIMDRRLLFLAGGRWRTVPLAGLGGVFGMAIDASRRLLWVATGPAEPMPDANTVFAGLIAVDLDELRVVKRVSIPGSRLGDATIASDGTVFASVSTSGAIYRCRPGCAAPDLLVGPGRLRSPQGLALSADERSLYIADYSLGLVRIDRASGAHAFLPASEPAMLEGIDGLVRHGDRLIAIQNGTNPRRILALALDPTGSRIQSIEVLERAHPDWGEPTLGALAGMRLIYVADSQWERFGPGGAMNGDTPLRPTAIRFLPLD